MDVRGQAPLARVIEGSVEGREGRDERSGYRSQQNRGYAFADSSE